MIDLVYCDCDTPLSLTSHKWHVPTSRNALVTPTNTSYRAAIYNKVEGLSHSASLSFPPTIKSVCVLLLLQHGSGFCGLPKGVSCPLQAAGDHEIAQ